MELNVPTVAALAGIVALWTAIFLAALKAMLDRERRHMDARFEAIQALTSASIERVQKLELELLRLKGDLPLEYVRREDWIRFGVTIHRKLDGLWEAIDALKERFYAGARSA